MANQIFGLLQEPEDLVSDILVNPADKLWDRGETFASTFTRINTPSRAGKLSGYFDENREFGPELGVRGVRMSRSELARLEREEELADLRRA